jgi:hypothetical protein
MISGTASRLRIVRTGPTNDEQESRQGEMPGNEHEDCWDDYSGWIF